MALNAGAGLPPGIDLQQLFGLLQNMKAGGPGPALDPFSVAKSGAMGNGGMSTAQAPMLSLKPKVQGNPIGADPGAMMPTFQAQGGAGGAMGLPPGVPMPVAPPAAGGAPTSSSASPAPSSGGGFLDWLKEPAFARDAAPGSVAAQLGATGSGMTQGERIASILSGFASNAGRAMADPNAPAGSWIGAGFSGAAQGAVAAAAQDRAQLRQEIGDRLEYLKATKGDNKPQAVAPGGALVDPTTGQAIFTNPNKEHEPTGMQAVIDSLSGGDPEKKKQLEALYFSAETNPNKGRVNVSLQQAPMNINIPGKEQVDSVQKFYGDTFGDLQKADLAAPASLMRNQRLGQLLGQIDTGSLEPLNQSVKGALKGAGVDLEALGMKDNVGAAQAATALSNQMALELRNPAGGAGMPGAMSDSDRSFLASMVPNLSTTQEGRKLIIGLNDATIKRSQAVARMARDYVAKNGKGIDQGFFDQLADFSAKNPIAPPVMTLEQAQGLPSGTQFVGTDGEVHVKL